jgi:myosin heavy subunit
MDKDRKTKLGLASATEYACLMKGNCYQIDGVDDKKGFDRVQV